MSSSFIKLTKPQSLESNWDESGWDQASGNGSQEGIWGLRNLQGVLMLLLFRLEPWTCLPHPMSWKIFIEWMNQSVMAGGSGLGCGKHFSLCCFLTSMMRSCLDKLPGRFVLWGGKRFSFSFYSLLIAKVILQ